MLHQNQPMMEENFSPQESLQAIHAMIEKAKNHFSENGHLYLVWGWVVFICSVSQFILMQLHYVNAPAVWMLTWAAVIYQFIYLFRQKKTQKVRTYAGSMIGFVWLSFLIMMALMVFLVSQKSESARYELLYPMFLALYGMPTFLCGILLKFKPLVIGGIGCWLLSILSVFASFEYQLLLIGSAMIIAWIIPGYMLRDKYKKQQPRYGR
jgi:hypothetical protein